MKTEDMKIMLCDDSILARKQLSDALKSLGCSNFIHAADGEQAIELYRQEMPDLVLLDIVMPKKDGITVVEEIIAINPDAKIVMVSSIGTKGKLAASIKAGAMDFIQKPFQLEQFEPIIRKVTEGR